MDDEFYGDTTTNTLATALDSAWTGDGSQTEESSYLVFFTQNDTFTLDVKNVTLSIKVQLSMYRYVLPMVGALIMLLNLAVVVSSGLIIKRGQQPKSTYMFLGNVALADFIIGCGLTFGQAYPNSQRTHQSCIVGAGVIVGCTLVSLYSVALIAIDRFVYIVHGINYQRWMYMARVKWSIAAVWFIGMVVGFTPTMGWDRDTKNGRVCWFIVLASPEALLLTSFVGCVPLVLVFIMYVMILYKAIKKVVQLKKMDRNEVNYTTSSLKLRAFRGGGKNSSSFSTSSDSMQESENHEVDSDTREHVDVKRKGRNNIFFITVNHMKESMHSHDGRTNTRQRNLSKWKAVKVIIITMGSFLVTWFAFFTICIIYVFCDSETSHQKCQRLRFALGSPLAIMGYVNCLLNPVIYAWWHEGFRKSIKRIVCKAKVKYNPETIANGQSNKPRINVNVI